MTEGPIKNMAASVKQRLLNLSREKNEDFNFLLGRYALERFLFRLCRSEYGGDFVLKGAMLFHLRSAGVPHRPTHDLDLLSKGNPGVDRLARLFRNVCSVDSPDDGIVFHAKTVHAERIKDDDEYLGVRIRVAAYMGSARIPFQVDVGFGDAVFPSPKLEQLSTLLDLPAPRLMVYPWEAVVAEKYHAIVELGLDNSRMKDYFDLHHMTKTMSFDGKTLAEAIRATFERRNTPLMDEAPVGLSASFSSDATKRTQWQAFLRKLRIEQQVPDLDAVIDTLVIFLMAPTRALANAVAFDKTWSPGGPWYS